MEFTRQQLKEFNQKHFNSVAARYARDAEKMLIEKEHQLQELSERLSEGRNYLMGVIPENISVEDALEAFGFGRNGLK